MWERRLALPRHALGRRRTEAEQALSRWALALGGAFALFVLGGIASGYLFYTSVRDIVANTGLPSFENLPLVGENRINMAYFLGEVSGYPGGGPTLAERTVELNFGVPIHYHVLIDFEGFVAAVDALGGISVEVERAIYDPNYPDNNFGVMSIYIPAGQQWMDGETALRYVRSRSGSSDWERGRRQQKVLLAIRDRVLRLDLLPRLPELLQRFGGILETNLQPAQILALAQIAPQVSSGNIRLEVIDHTRSIPVILESGADVLFPDRASICQVIQEIFQSCPAAAPAQP
ncbi:MAG: LCP family protein [Chloroflexi bacterium]|nr:LCP family protein [Chloroflexota bacterium]